MRMYRLLMPAVTVAGALALAGCGGGSSTPGGPPAGSDPETLEFAKGGFHNAGDGRLLLCDSDDGCELTVKDGKVQETEAELTDAGFTITNRRTPPLTDMETKAEAAKVSRLFGAAGSTNSGVYGQASEVNDQEADSPPEVTPTGSPTFSDGKVKGVFDWDTNRATHGIDVESVELEATEDMVRSIAGWKGTRYEGKEGTDGHGHVAVFYSNQGEPKEISFKAWTEQDGNALTLVDAAGDVPAHVAGSETAAFGDGNEITGFTKSVRGTTHTSGSSVVGSLSGAAGTFQCTALTCASNERPTGVGWIFIPASGATVEEADTGEYIRFGGWLRTDKDGEWANFAPVVTRHGETAAVAATVDEDWSGKATYEGGAVGVYAINRGSGQSGNEAGWFTAKATLTADFEAEGDNAGTGGSIKGTVDDFMVDGTQKPWKVDLLETRLTAEGATGFSKDDDGTQWTMIEGGTPADADGEWSGNLYNENGGTDAFAESVAGDFKAQYENIGNMRGAFGANEK